MTASDIWTIVAGGVQGVGAAAFIAVLLFGGVSVLVTLLKFRSTKNTRTIKSLDELVGHPASYLPPDAPRGPIDQLRGSGPAR